MKDKTSTEGTEKNYRGSQRSTRFVVLLALVGSRIAMAQMPGEGITVSKDNRTIAITATDSVTAIADVATVHLGFQIYGADHDSTYAAGTKLSNAIVDALKAAGVASDAVESVGQSIQPVQPYERQNFTDAEKGQRQFSLNQSWTVRAAATDAARILDLAVKAGANASGQIDWSLKDSNAPEAEAAGKALQRARAVAESMARGLNVKLGTLIYASNTTQAQAVRPAPKALGMAVAQAAAVVQPLAINPRQIEKTATVYAVFAIE